MAALAAGCGGGDDAPAQVVNSNLKVNATASTTQSVAGKPITFGAVPSFGTTGTTTLVLGTGTTPGFTISSGGQTATGTTTFGSCIFSVNGSSFAPTSPLGGSRVVTVNPCEITINTQGAAAGSTSTRTVSFNLGGVTGTAEVTVTIGTDGTVTVSGTVLGSVTLAPVTGA